MNEQLVTAMADADESRVLELIEKEFEEGADPNQVLNDCRSGMEIVGKRFEQGEYFLFDLIMSGRVFGKAMSLIEPRLASVQGYRTLGKVVIGTPKGDLHDIGKNIVATMLRCAGFEVHDLGIDVPAGRFAEAANQLQADIVGMSALLTTTFQPMKEAVALIRDTERGKMTKIIVGGAPVNEQVRAHVGADAYGADAAAAVQICKRLVGDRHDGR